MPRTIYKTLKQLKEILAFLQTLFLVSRMLSKIALAATISKSRFFSFPFPGAYVCSQNKRFIAANYGKTGDAFSIGGRRVAAPRLKRIQHAKKPGTNSAPSSGGKSKPSSADGRIIRIVNAADHSVSERVLLNLKTTQGSKKATFYSP